MVVGFGAYEEIGFIFHNLNFGSFSFDEAKALVKEGRGKWAWCLGGVLSYVSNDYVLKENEKFLVRKENCFYEV